MNYLFILIATILLAFEFAISKKYQQSEGTGLLAGLKFNAANGLFTTLVFFILSEGNPGFSFFSVGMAFCMSLCAMVYSILGFRILRQGTLGIYSLFLMSGGMLLPYAFGVLFLDEELNVLRIAGVMLILAAIILSNRTRYDFQPSFYLICLLIFVLNGFVSILSKCHQIDRSHAPVDSTAFVMYTGIAKFVMSSAVLLLYKGNRKERFSFQNRHIAAFIAGSSLISGLSYLLQLIGAKSLPATVLYPMITGGSIIFSALSGIIFFREKLTRRQLIHILLCFAGTLLFL